MNSHFPPDDHSPVQMSHDANLVATLHPGISRYRSHFINTDDTRLWRWQTISRYDGPFFHRRINQYYQKNIRLHVGIVPKSTSLSMKTVKNFSMERYLDNQPLEYISEKLSISPTDVETCVKRVIKQWKNAVK